MIDMKWQSIRCADWVDRQRQVQYWLLQSRSCAIWSFLVILAIKHSGAMLDCDGGMGGRGDAVLRQSEEMHRKEVEDAENSQNSNSGQGKGRREAYIA
jgi:hypothetical protein